jgi:hypothetical protein
MKTAPDEPNLLDDVLGESARDSLGPMLRAIRARRRRREAAPVVAALVAVALGWWSLNAPGRGRSAGETAAEFADSTPAAVKVAPLFQRVNSRALTSSERVARAGEFGVIARVQTGPQPGLRASDGELFALAGGRGVGLFRFPGHTELLIAATR